MFLGLIFIKILFVETIMLSCVKNNQNMVQHWIHVYTTCTMRYALKIETMNKVKEKHINIKTGSNHGKKFTKQKRYTQ